VNPGSIAGIILAGGASRRMGTPKALLRFQGETFLDRLIRLFSAVANPVIVVVGHHAEAIRSGIQRSSEVVFAVNPDPERGMLSSLQCGLEAVPPEAAAVLFTPVDHPHLEGSTLERLIADFLAKQAPVTVPVHDGKHGHPVCIARPVMAELLGLPPEAQASDVIHRYVSQTSYIEVPDSSILTDVDDQTAYAELMSREAPR
jgi:molybdenum cofactor cytidylyltransferase